MPSKHESGFQYFDEGGIGRWHDVEMMADVAMRARDRGDVEVSRMCVLLPGVLDRIVQIEKEREREA